MNFDFLNNLEGLNRLYAPCTDAEELAYSKPYLSMTASRKSAELLAKFVYMVAHSNKMDDMTFADILFDDTTRNYIKSTKVIDAFHFIRKSGNKAVHGDAIESVDDAIAVLKNLHYVVGETAKRVGLISKYPTFNETTDKHPEFEYHEIRDTTKLAKEMFSDYITEYRLSKLQAEYASFCSPIQLDTGNITLHEYVEFKNKPVLPTTIPNLQEYFGYLTMNALKGLYSSEGNGQSLEFHAKLTILGDENYSTNNLFEFMEGIMNKLPSATHFVINSYYEGADIRWDDNIRKKLDQSMDSIREMEDFTYKLFSFYNCSGTVSNKKIQHGKWVDIRKDYTHEIVHNDFGVDWWCWNLDMVVEFDFSKYSDVLKLLQETVKKHIPSDQLKYCEDAWKDGEKQILVNSIQWITRKLSEVQNFLDEINKVLRPIMSECECYALGEWEITDGEFAVATWDWFDEGFKVVGTSY